MTAKSIILAAFPPELEPLLSSEDLRTLNVDTALVGIGMVSAAAEVSRLLSRYPTPPARVIFVGSAGSADENVSLFSTVIATEALLSDIALAQENGYLPQNTTTRLAADAKLVNALKEHSQQANNLTGNLTPNIFTEPIYSSLAITSDNPTAQLHRVYTGARFENLELFGVATACDAAGVPWTAVSTLTNYLDPDAHQQWRENYVEAAKQTARVVSELIGSA